MGAVRLNPTHEMSLSEHVTNPSNFETNITSTNILDIPILETVEAGKASLLLLRRVILQQNIDRRYYTTFITKSRLFNEFYLILFELKYG